MGQNGLGFSKSQRLVDGRGGGVETRELPRFGLVRPDFSSVAFCQGPISAQGILHLWNPNLVPNSGK